MVQELIFTHAFWQIERLGQADGCRNGLVDQIFQGRNANHFQHFLNIGRTRSHLTRSKITYFHAICV